ncbi:MAG: YciI family protein [Fimbriimonadales bacterium]
MKYMLLFCGTLAEDEAWRSMPPEQIAEAYKRVEGWFATNGGGIEGGYELQPASTATTVRKDENGSPFVTDGPYAESGEVVGGYVIVKADDLDQVLALAKTWPGGAVEVRPVVER